MAFLLRYGLITSGMNVNVWDVNDQVQTLIQSRKQFDPAALADPGTALDSLV